MSITKYYAIIKTNEEVDYCMSLLSSLFGWLCE